MSFMLLGILNSQASGGGFAYWLATLGGSSVEQGHSVAIDLSGNSFSFGNTESAGAGDNDFLISKRDGSGTIQWQRVLGGTSQEFGRSVATDSSDNVYVFGDTSSTGAGGQDFLLAKYNSSGTIQWQRVFGGTGSESGRAVATDSSDNVYVFGYTPSTGAGGQDFLLAKYNSAGSIQWQRVLGGASGEEGFSVATDSSDNVYVFGNTDSTGQGETDFLLAKYNSSGTIQWQRILGGTSNEFGKGVAVDASDNVYILGQTLSTGAGGRDFLLAKYNSSGTIQWQRVFGGTSDEFASSAAVDSLDNLYVFGNTESAGAGGKDFLIAKYNSSGVIQWQRVLGGTLAEEGNSVALDPLDNLYVFGNTTTTGAGNKDFFLAKLPNDGSLIGTYELDGNNLVYAASTLTAATSSLTAATSSLTAATSSLTSATSSLTDASASLTDHFVGIG